MLPLLAGGRCSLLCLELSPPAVTLGLTVALLFPGALARIGDAPRTVPALVGKVRVAPDHLLQLLVEFVPESATPLKLSIACHVQAVAGGLVQQIAGAVQ